MGESTRIAVVAALVAMAFALGWLVRARQPDPARPPTSANAECERLTAELIAERARAQDSEARAALLAGQQRTALESGRERLAALDRELVRLRAIGPGSEGSAEMPAGSGSVRETPSDLATLQATLAARERQLAYALEEVARLEQMVELLQMAPGPR